MSSSINAAILVIPLAIAACAESPDVATVGPQSASDLPQQAVNGPFVHAGAAMPVTIDQDLDSQNAAPGTSFTAHTQAPLRDEHGTLVVPQGATVRGHVVSTGPSDAPRLRLAFDSVDTAAGPARLAASIEHAQRSVHPGPPEVVPAPPSRVYVDDYLYPMDFLDYGSPDWPTNTLTGAQALYFPREIHVPAGGSMLLVLTRPILPPGSQVVGR